MIIRHVPAWETVTVTVIILWTTHTRHISHCLRLAERIRSRRRWLLLRNSNGRNFILSVPWVNSWTWFLLHAAAISFVSLIVICVSGLIGIICVSRRSAIEVVHVGVLLDEILNLFSPCIALLLIEIFKFTTIAAERIAHILFLLVITSQLMSGAFALRVQLLISTACTAATFKLWVFVTEQIVQVRGRSTMVSRRLGPLVRSNLTWRCRCLRLWRFLSASCHVIGHESLRIVHWLAIALVVSVVISAVVALHLRVSVAAAAANADHVWPLEFDVWLVRVRCGVFVLVPLDSIWRSFFLKRWRWRRCWCFRHDVCCRLTFHQSTATAQRTSLRIFWLKSFVTIFSVALFLLSLFPFRDTIQNIGVFWLESRYRRLCLIHFWLCRLARLRLVWCLDHRSSLLVFCQFIFLDFRMWFFFVTLTHENVNLEYIYFDRWVKSPCECSLVVRIFESIERRWESTRRDIVVVAWVHCALRVTRSLAQIVIPRWILSLMVSVERPSQKCKINICTFREIASRISNETSATREESESQFVNITVVYTFFYCVSTTSPLTSQSSSRITRFNDSHLNNQEEFHDESKQLSVIRIRDCPP